MKIWLRADDIDADNDFTDNPAVGATVAQWRDYSGTNYHFANGVNNNRPTYRLFGGIPSVYFNSASATARFLTGSASANYTSASAFFALNSPNSPNNTVLLENGTHSLRFEQFNNTGLIGFTRYGVEDYLSALSSPSGVNSIVSFHKAAASSNMTYYSNNLSSTASIASTGYGIPIDRLGSSNTTVDEISGDFFEIIVYDNLLNSAELIIVNNYLSSKYNIAIPNNIYIQDDPANGGFRFDVAGIGRVNSTNLHTDSQGTGMIRILNPSGLTNNEFLLWGHNNLLAQAANITDVPPTMDARFERVWRVSEVNATGGAINVGNIDMRFDLTGLGPITASDLRLLVDTDGDGLFADETPIAGASLVSGSIYQFTAVSQIENGRRFTIGTINNILTPLPVGLTKFDAKLTEKRTVELSWQTAFETNNESFTVERSKNGTDWADLLTKKGAGNSISTLNYYAIDSLPLAGVSYYRLKQTDFNGSINYHKIAAVDNSLQIFESIEIFPNPSHGYFQISGDIDENEKIVFYNSLGQDVSDLFDVISVSDGLHVYDSRNLPSGLYAFTYKGKFYKILVD